MRRYKRPRNEPRGDKYDHWGKATYFFEADDQGVVSRKVEIYEAGQVLRYDQEHSKDDFGMLADQELQLGDFEPYRISREEFETAWRSGAEAGPVGAR
jgi:hypothetical protein